jgi:hypothetical protein
MMENEPEDLQSEPEPEGFSWAAYIGAVSGLVVGICLAHGGSLLAFRFWPESGIAGMVWDVSAPLLALLGLLGGAWSFQRFLKDQVILSTAIFMALVALGVATMFVWFGFPWLGPTP